MRRPIFRKNPPHLQKAIFFMKNFSSFSPSYSPKFLKNHSSLRLFLLIFCYFSYFSSSEISFAQNIFKPQDSSLISSIAVEISPYKTAQLLLIFAQMAHTHPTEIRTLHQCSRAFLSEETTSQLPQPCQEELTTLTYICLAHYPPKSCSEVDSLIMLHGATSLEPLILP